MIPWRKKTPEPKPEQKPYDYLREQELIDLGDLHGWQAHVMDRPAEDTLYMIIHCTDAVSRINIIRREKGEI